MMSNMCRSGADTCLHKLAGDALQLSLGEVLGIAAHAALGAAKRNVHHRRLPCRQARQAKHRITSQTLAIPLLWGLTSVRHCVLPRDPIWNRSPYTMYGNCAATNLPPMRL